MILKRIFARRPDIARTLYEAIVAAARQAVFYEKWGVADTIDGRFDMIVLHLFLLLERLKDEKAEAEELRQKLTDTFFLDMDRSLREMGVGDLSVGKKVRKMSEAYYGRIAAYADAATPDAMRQALARNIYPGQPDEAAEQLAGWVQGARQALAAQEAAGIMAGEVRFS